MINDFLSWPSFSQEEADAVSRVLLSNQVNYWTGTECRDFEEDFADYTGCNHAIALANGTVALDLAFKALGIGEGDEVVVTSRTFIASVSSIVLAGATPVFADVDRDSQNINASTVKQVLTPRTKAIVAVHLAGLPCEMDGLMQLAEQHQLFVIEDCAQAHGAKYKNRPVGSIGHIGAWSFCQDKIMTTGGEGGMVTTNDYELWNKMWSYKDHGKSFDAVYNEQHPPGFRWLHHSFGTNWRMTEMQAVIGRLQLKKMPSWTKARQGFAEQIDNVCKKISALRVPSFSNEFEHAKYKHYVFIRPEYLKKDWSRDRIIEEITQLGVPCFQGSCSEVYLEKAFEGTSFRPAERLKVARELAETSLMFLVHPTLTQEEKQKTCAVILEIMEKASI